MIFVAAGTQDGRELAGFLLARGYAVTASVVSSYGEELLRRYKGIQINDKPLDAEGLLDYIKEHGIKCFIDASHPYAANVSVNAMQACHIAGIPYLRYERQESRLEYDRAFYVSSYAEAAEKASELGKNIFLTTGSRNLKAFAGAGCLKDCRIVCRVLPDPEVLAECAGLGFTPDNIIAMQGPFFAFLRTQLPEPVTVHCAVGVRTPPYSSGNLYCRSAEQKCDEVTHIAVLAAPLSTNTDAIISPCAIVEHAPY